MKILPNGKQLFIFLGFYYIESMDIKRLCFTIAAFLLALFLIEVCARIAEKTVGSVHLTSVRQPGWQTEFFSHSMDFHEPDPRLLWRHRANLDNPLIQTNSDGLLGGEIPDEKDGFAFRILLLGDSSPVGLGLQMRNEAFGEQLKFMLDQYFAGTKRVELINAAVSGYSSEQVRRFMELRGLSYNPDLVIIYCGNNDASISGQFTDRQLMESQPIAQARDLFGKLAIYRIFRSWLGGSSRTETEDPTSLAVRVSPERYYQNLESIAEACRANNLPLVVIKPPVPLLWPAGLQFKIFRHITGDDGQPIFPKALADILGRDIKYCLKEDSNQTKDRFAQVVFASAFDAFGTPTETIDEMKTDLQHDGENPLLENNLGVSYWETEQFDSARVYLNMARRDFCRENQPDVCPAVVAAGSPFLFNQGVNYLSMGHETMAEVLLDSALQADYFSLRIKREYWEAVDSVGHLDNVTVIDLPSIFEESGGDCLFVDHCHPTLEGHRLIAQALFNAIRKII